MSHMLSEPDSKHTSSLTGPAAKGYRSAPSSMSNGSTTRLKHPDGTPRNLNSPDPMVEPQALYHDGNAAYTHPDLPSGGHYTKPAHSTEAQPVQHAANYWQKVAESNSDPQSPSIEQATSKALHGAKPPKGI